MKPKWLLMYMQRNIWWSWRMTSCQGIPCSPIARLHHSNLWRSPTHRWKSEVTNDKSLALRKNVDLAIDLMYVFVTVANFCLGIKRTYITTIAIGYSTGIKELVIRREAISLQLQGHEIWNFPVVCTYSTPTPHKGLELFRAIFVFGCQKNFSLRIAIVG